MSPPERRPDVHADADGKSGDGDRQVEFFIDRSLGRRHLAHALEDLGFLVHTMTSVTASRLLKNLMMSAGSPTLASTAGLS